MSQQVYGNINLVLQRRFAVWVLLAIFTMTLFGTAVVSMAHRNLEFVGVLQYVQAVTLTGVQPADAGSAGLGQHDDSFVDGVALAYAGDLGGMQSVLGQTVLTGQQRDWLAWSAVQTMVRAHRPADAATLWQLMTPAVQQDTLEMATGLTVTYEQSGRLPEAEQLLMAIRSFRPLDVSGYENLAQFYLRDGRNEDAIGAFDAQAAVTDSGFAAFLRGRAAELQGRWRDAVDAYTAAVANGRRDPAMLYRLAFVTGIRLDDPAAAIPYCTEAIRQSPTGYACYELLGLLSEKTGDYVQAKEWYVSGLEHVASTSYRAMFWRRIGDIERGAANLPDAIAAYNLALQENAADAGAARGLALALSASGQLSEAISHQETAISLMLARGEKPPAAWYEELGKLYEQQGDTARAVAAFESAAALNGADETAGESE